MKRNKAMFPEFDTIPHADTVARLLEKLEVSQILECMIDRDSAITIISEIGTDMFWKNLFSKLLNDGYYSGILIR